MNAQIQENKKGRFYIGLDGDKFIVRNEEKPDFVAEIKEKKLETFGIDRNEFLICLDKLVSHLNNGHKYMRLDVTPHGYIRINSFRGGIEGCVANILTIDLWPTESSIDHVGGEVISK